MADKAKRVELFTVKKFKIHPDDDCTCGAVYFRQCKCDEVEDPRGTLTNISVSVLQDRTNLKRQETPYFVKIKTYSTTVSEEKKITLEDISFTITSTEDQRDLDISNKEHVQKHLSNIEGKEIVSQDTSIAPIDKYYDMLFFHMLIRDILKKTPEPEPEPSYKVRTGLSKKIQ